MSNLSALQKVILVKMETTYKTDSVPTGALNAILIRNTPKLTAMKVQTDDRANAKAHFGADQSIVTAANCSLEVEVEIAGGGTPLGTAPAWGPLMRACGCLQTINGTTSVTYGLRTPAPESVSVYFFQGDKRFIMLGARGTSKRSYVAGRLPLATFTLEGVLPAASHVTDDATYGGTLDLTKFLQPLPVAFGNTTFSLHGFGSAALYSAEIEQGNSYTYRNKPNVEDVVITGRSVTGRIRIAEPTIAQINYFDRLRNATLGAMTITHGATAGNIITESFPAAQIVGLDMGEEDNVRTLDLQLRFLPSTGNDEHLITCT